MGQSQRSKTMVAKVNAQALFRRASFVGNKGHIVINGSGHTKGRLSASIAKALMQGRKVSVVKCEKIVQSGSVTKNVHRWQRFLNLKGNTNPRIRSHQHRKAPSMMFWRCVRASIKHKTNRGLQGLLRLKCYDGVPRSLFEQPLYKVPDALSYKIYKPRRKTCTLGDIATQVGWKHGEAVAELEVEREAVKTKLIEVTEEAKKCLTKEELELVNRVGLY